MRLAPLAVGSVLFFCLAFGPTALARAEDDAILAITIEPRALYLTSLRAGGGRHGGPELALGLRIPFAPSWSVVLRGRGALAFDIESPEGERNATSCGGYYFYSCSRDDDMRYPVGGEAGVRLDDATPLGDAAAFVVGAELSISGSAYLDSYEETSQESGALGAAASLTLELLFGERWGVGLAAGGRLEADLDGNGGWAAAHGGVRISRRF